jgi:hypothetical protein
MNPVRVIVAFLLAPLIVPIAILVRDVVKGGGASPYHSEIAWIFVFATVTSYLAILILGLPLTYILKRFRRLVLSNLVLGGIVVGGITIVAFVICFALLLGSPVHIEDIDAEALAAGAGFGAITAAIFGLIAGVPVTSKLPLN